MDVVGNDLYDISGRATWDAAHDLYEQYPGKPYAFPEWGLWGIDDPGFIRRHARAGSTTTAGRAPRLVQRPGAAPSGIWRSKPASRKAYRRHITPLGRLEPRRRGRLR